MSLPGPAHLMPDETPDAPWSARASSTLYGLEHWGAGYFGVSERGTLVARPNQDPNEEIDLLELIRGLEKRDIPPPVALRFDGILEHRMGHIRRSFDAVIRVCLAEQTLVISPNRTWKTPSCDGLRFRSRRNR